MDPYLMAQAIGGNRDAGWVLRQGVVVSIQAYSLTVRIAGSATDVSGVKYLGAPPPPNAGVWLLANGSDIIVLGSVAALGRTIAPRVYRNDALTLTTGTDTLLTWQADERDDYGMWTSGAPTVLTCQVPGRYVAGLDVRFAANATGVRAGWIEVNSTTVVGRVRMAATSALPAQLTVASQAFTMSIGDTVRAYVEQTSGGNLDLVVSGSSPSLSVMYLGP
jgi:hypothetical protein